MFTLLIFADTDPGSQLLRSIGVMVISRVNLSKTTVLQVLVDSGGGDGDRWLDGLLWPRPLREDLLYPIRQRCLPGSYESPKQADVFLRDGRRKDTSVQ